MTSRLFRSVALALALCLLPVGVASASTIDFESLPEFTSVTNQFAGMTFSRATVLTAGSGLNEFEFPPHSGANVIFDDGGPIIVTFTGPVISFSGFFTYLAPLTISAFNSSDLLLGSVSSSFISNLGLSGDAGSSPNEFLQVAFANMAYVRIVGGPVGGSFTADDITLRSAVAAVPEPGTIGLLVGGLGVLAGLRRRRVVDTP